MKNELRLIDIKEQMVIIDHRHFEQFYLSVLHWYMEEIRHPRLFFDGNADEPPNLFYLFEYPNEMSEVIIDLFKDSVWPNDEGSSEKYNAVFPELFEHMVIDTSTILNNERLFFRYRDDTNANNNYFNRCITEVW